MAFDSAGFEPPPEPTPPPKPPKHQETVLLIVFFIAGVGLLILPISADSLVDLANYLFGG